MGSPKPPTTLRYWKNWWIYYLLVLFVLFLLESFATKKSRRYIWLEERREVFRNEFQGNEMPENLMESNSLESMGLELSFKRHRESQDLWEGWTMRIYVAMTLSSVCAAFLSLILPTPPVLILLLFLAPFAGAYIYSRSWRKEED